MSNHQGLFARITAQRKWRTGRETQQMTDEQKASAKVKRRLRTAYIKAHVDEEHLQEAREMLR